MKILYKYSDKGKLPQLRGKSIDKKKIFQIFLKSFNINDIYLWLDNCNDETITYFKSFVNNIKITKLGNGGTFRDIFNFALTLNDNEIVYFAEDDYLHCENSSVCIEEGLNISHYVSLYDHFDKYVDGWNPFVKNGGENTKVMITKSTHWKYTNSTTGTFACRVGTLRDDKEIFIRLSNPDMMDFQIFCELYRKGKTLITPIPSKSTHLIDPMIAPIVNWDKLL